VQPKKHSRSDYATGASKARFEDRELLKQFQEVERLPDEDKNVVKKLLDAFLTKKHLQALIRTLSPQQVAEVEDFVEFLAAKARKRAALDRLMAIAPI
jgi:hypothetical protein